MGSEIGVEIGELNGCEIYGRIWVEWVELK